MDFNQQTLAGNVGGAAPTATNSTFPDRAGSPIADMDLRQQATSKAHAIIGGEYASSMMKAAGGLLQILELNQVSQIGIPPATPLNGNIPGALFSSRGGGG